MLEFCRLALKQQAKPNRALRALRALQKLV
jgi:hypothetical protein